MFVSISEAVWDSTLIIKDQDFSHDYTVPSGYEKVQYDSCSFDGTFDTGNCDGVTINDCYFRKDVILSSDNTFINSSRIKGYTTINGDNTTMYDCYLGFGLEFDVEPCLLVPTLSSGVNQGYGEGTGFIMI